MKFNPSTGEFEFGSPNPPPPPPERNSGCGCADIIITIIVIWILISIFSFTKETSKNASSHNSTTVSEMHSSGIADTTFIFADSTTSLIDSLALDSTNIQIYDNVAVDSPSYSENDSHIFIRNANKNSVAFSFSCDNVTYYDQYLDSNGSSKCRCENLDIYIRININKNEKQYTLERGKKYVLNMDEYGVWDVFYDQ